MIKMTFYNREPMSTADLNEGYVLEVNDIYDATKAVEKMWKKGCHIAIDVTEDHEE